MKLSALVLSLAVAATVGCGDDSERSNGAEPANQPQRETVAGIVFARDGDIFAVDPETGHEQSVIRTPEIIESFPRWSPDRRRIAFVTGDGAIHVVNGDGSGRRRVVAAAPGTEAPAWSPDGRQLVYTATNGEGYSLRVAGVGGRKRQRELASIGRGFAGSPDWSPDGRRIVFELGEDDLKLYVVAASGGQPRRLIRTGGHQTSPRWSKDGRRILYAVAGEGLFTATPSGRGVTRLAGTTDQDIWATWSPRGDQVAWTTPGSALSVMAAGGGKPQRVGKPVVHETPIDW